MESIFFQFRWADNEGCWFADDGPPPSPTYRNRLQEMQWLTTTLVEFNKKNGGFPHVHKFGVRIDNRSNKDEYGNMEVRHRTCHKWEDAAPHRPQEVPTRPSG